MKKFSVVALSLFISFGFILSASAPVKAATIEELQAQIKAMTAQLTPTVTSPYFTTTSFAQNPTLSLSYNNLREESSLSGEAILDIKADDYKDLIIYWIGLGLTDQNGKYVYANNSVRTFEAISNVTKETINYAFGGSNDVYRIKAGQTGRFQIRIKENPQTLFAGTYKFNVSSIGIATDSTDQNANYDFDSVKPPLTTSNAVPIVGERSPYITSVKPPEKSGNNATLYGVRFATGYLKNIVYINGVKKGSVVSRDGTSLVVPGTLLAEIYKMGNASYSIQIESPKYGKSNIVYTQTTGISIISPNGDIYYPNSSYRILWKPSSGIATVRLAYYAKGSSKGGYFAQGIPASQSYFDFDTGPSPLTGNFILEIQGLDSKNNVLATSKSEFSIQSTPTQPSITVLSPTEGTYKDTDPLNISWTPYTGDFDYYYVLLGNRITGQENTLTPDRNVSKNISSYTPTNLELKGAIRDILANSGGKTADQLKDSYYISIQAQKEPQSSQMPGTIVSRASGNNFTITSPTTQPSITVNYPKKGDFWRIGNTYTIQFSISSSAKAPYKVYLDKYFEPSSGKSGVNSSVLLGETNTNSLLYTVPGSFVSWPGSGWTFKIRVCDASQPCAVSGSSDNFFSIASQLHMDYPNGGETLRKGETITIKWNKDNVTFPTVDIWLLDNPTRYGSVILKSTPNDGSESWLVSALGQLEGKDGQSITPSGNYVMFISCSDSNCIVDDSDSSFTITSPTASLTITPVSLAEATVGSAYSASFDGTGVKETASYQLAISGGSAYLPPGMSIVPLRCRMLPCRDPLYISGTPTTAGTYPIQVQLLSPDSTGKTITTLKDYKIVVKDNTSASSITATFVSATTNVVEGPEGSVGNYSIKFKVKAAGGNVYIPSSSGLNFAVGGEVPALPSGSISPTITITDNTTTSAGNYLLVNGGEYTMELKVSVHLGQADTRGSYRLILNGIKWGVADDSTPENTLTINPEFMTGYEELSSLQGGQSFSLASIQEALNRIMEALKSLTR